MIYYVETNEKSVTIPLEEYKRLLEKCARYDLLAEQERKREKEMQKWLEKAEAEQKKGEEQC